VTLRRSGRRNVNGGEAMAVDLETRARISTIGVVLETRLSAETVLEGARDFSERRTEIFPAVQRRYLKIHELGDVTADVTEGTRSGPIVNWERCRYDWSQPGSITATVIDSNIYAIPGSSWELKAAATDQGCRVEMTWIRGFRRRPKGMFFGFLFTRIGPRLFDKYARDIVANLERLEGRVNEG
jgi:hypothetical protein